MHRRILHLLANWKWTERSEPVVDLALAQQRLGTQVCLVCGTAPEEAGESVALRAEGKGLHRVTTLSMSKHLHLCSLLRDIPKLNALLNAFRPHVVHSHMRNDHLLGAFAGVPVGRAVPSVRSCYDPSGPKTDLRSRWLYHRHTDGLIVISQRAESKARQVFGFRDDAVLVAEPGVDLDRFSPYRQVDLTRKDLGLRQDAFVIGMVTRIRESRRIDVVLEAVHILTERFPQIELFIVGRGRKGAVETVIEGPSRSMGIGDKLILPGYCTGDRLVAAYQAMDVLVYPVPGTDRTCRTVREALASGVPVLAPNVGFLPELLEEGINGRFIPLSAHRLADVLADLIDNPAQLHRMGINAADAAKRRFSTHLQAHNVLAFYERLLAAGKPHSY